MTVDLNVVIPMACTMVALVLSVVNLRRSAKKDDRASASEMATVLMKLEHISNTVAEIKLEMSNVKTDTKENREEIIRTKESSRQAHKRIDELSRRVDELSNK